MALDLKDLRAKITARTWCFLEGESRATGKEISEVVRDLLDDWAGVRLHAGIESHKLLQAEGELGIVRESKAGPAGT